MKLGQALKIQKLKDNFTVVKTELAKDAVVVETIERGQLESDNQNVIGAISLGQKITIPSRFGERILTLSRIYGEKLWFTPDSNMTFEIMLDDFIQMVEDGLVHDIGGNIVSAVMNTYPITIGDRKFEVRAYDEFQAYEKLRKSLYGRNLIEVVKPEVENPKPVTDEEPEDIVEEADGEVIEKQVDGTQSIMVVEGNIEKIKAELEKVAKSVDVQPMEEDVYRVIVDWI